jgi:hypothetical protein
MDTGTGNIIFRIKHGNRSQPKWGGQYPHVVGDKLYYELQEPGEVCCVEFDDGVVINKPNNCILKNSLGTNNFKCFLDTKPDIPEEERYKAVAGYHVSNSHAELVGFMESEEISLFDPVWPNVKRTVLKDDFYHPRHANGLYVFVSSDGLNWKEYYNKPVISMFNRCVDFEDMELPLGVLGLDWMPSIFFDHNIMAYVLYLRANLALGCRHVLYSRSDDLINWSIPKLISCNPDFDIENNQNFYYGAVYPIKNKYIAFPPHFTNKILTADGSQRAYTNACTHVMISNDGISWETVDKIFKSNTDGHMTFPHVVSFEDMGDNFLLYVHEGFGTSDNMVVKYTITAEQLNILL